MKRTLKTITCAMVLVASTHAQAQDPSFNIPVPPQQDASVVGDLEFEGDSGGSVGDMDVVGDISTPVSFRTKTSGPNFVGDTVLDETDSETPVPTPMPSLETLDVSESSTVSHTHSPVVYSVRKKTNKWLRADTLLWFLEERDSPPLLQTGATNVKRFGDPIETGLAPGFRIDYGHYFGDSDDYGIGIRISGLIGEDDDYSITSVDPANLITRPFFNINAVGGAQLDAWVVSGLGTHTGTFSAESEFDYFASEVYGRLNFDRASCYRIDVITGFSAFAIDDELTLTSNSVLLPNERLFRDVYDVDNRFYGGQLGLETMFHKGKWSLTTLTKVHLGNMNSRAAISGFSRSGIFPDPPGPGTNFANGFYVQGQQGIHEQDNFAFAPEIGLKLGFKPRSNVEFNLGYTFLYWSSLALAGDQIDFNVDGNLLLTNTAGAQAALYELQTDGFWMQGIDLGVTLHY